MSKKIISLLLAVMLTVSMVAVAAVSVSAEVDPEGRYVAPEGTDTYRYYFYMPEEWSNEESSDAGIYWWAGTDACPTWQDMYKMQKGDYENLFYVDIATDVETIIFTNAVPDGENAKQSKDASVYYGMGDDEAYNNYVYVIDPEKSEINDYSGATVYVGDWVPYDEFVASLGDEPAASEPEATEPEAPAAALTVNATSNLFPEATVSYADVDTVTVTYFLQADKGMVNAQWELSYDPEVLSVNVDAAYNEKDECVVMPVVGDDGSIYNLTGVEGLVTGNCSKLKLYSYETEQPFVQVTFDVIGEGETTVDLTVQALSFADKDPGTRQAVEPFDRLVFDSVVATDVATNYVLRTELTPTDIVVPVPSDPETSDPETSDPETSDPETSEPASEEDTTAPAPATDATSSTLAPATSDQPTAPTTGGNGAVQTGDASLAIVILALLISATGVMFVLRKREML